MSQVTRLQKVDNVPGDFPGRVEYRPVSAARNRDECRVWQSFDDPARMRARKDIVLASPNQQHRCVNVAELGTQPTKVRRSEEIQPAQQSSSRPRSSPFLNDRPIELAGALDSPGHPVTKKRPAKEQVSGLNEINAQAPRYCGGKNDDASHSLGVIGGPFEAKNAAQVVYHQAEFTWWNGRKKCVEVVFVRGVREGPGDRYFGIALSEQVRRDQAIATQMRNDRLVQRGRRRNSVKRNDGGPVTDIEERRRNARDGDLLPFNQQGSGSRPAVASAAVATTT